MKRSDKERRQNAALLLLLLAVAFGGPLLLGTYLLQAASAPAPLNASSASAPADLTQVGATQSAGVTSPLVSGVLYTNGPVKVNWNGIRIPVESSTYAYSGGELISTAPNAMGILKLDSGSVVFICPKSKIRVSKSPSGETLLDVVAGGGRFMFQENDPFQVKVKNTTLSAAPDRSGDALTRHAYTGESVVTEDGGCVLCNLSKNLQVGVDGGSSRSSTVATGGQIVTVSGAGGPNPISSLELPQNVFAGMRAAMVSNGTTGLGYLCKCRELRDYAARAGRQLAGAPDLSLTTTLAQAPGGPVSDASPGLPQPPSSEPLVEPPPVPDVTIADGGAPDPFVPGLLPAAGDSQQESEIILPPSLVPGSGPGGGGTVSNS